MANVVVTGGGMIGLTTAMLLAKDGHEVTVLERDPQPPPTPGEAWESWERRGVNQFRLLHYFQPGWRAIVETELPELAAAMDQAGAARYNVLDQVPTELFGPPQPGDADCAALTARRPVAEAAAAAAAGATPGVTIRRGVAVAGLLAGGTPAAPGVPHVTGVVTESGEEIGADIVVEATGRRSPLPAWLEAVGAKPPVNEEEDLGFQYYGRHFRSADGSMPALIGGLLIPYGSFSVLTLPADNGTWGVGIITSGRDAALRGLKDNDTWSRVMGSAALQAHWIDAEPLDDVAVMAKIPDRYRRFVVDGAPVATGVLAVGDSWACTNPSLGRGITIGALHAVALRDVLRTGALDDPAKLALAWDEATEATVTPWYRTTLAFDRHRLAEINAEIDGHRYETDDPQWPFIQAYQQAAGQDGEVLRAFLRSISLLDSPTAPMAPSVMAKVMDVAANAQDTPSLGPSRSELLALVAG